MPIKLITSGGGSAILTPTSKATDYTLTVPAVTANVITSADSNTITQAMFSTGLAATGPAFSAYLSAQQTPVTAATWTKVNLNAEEFDTANCFDSTTNYRFTPNVAGYYHLIGNLNFNNGSAVYSGVSIYKNGSSFKSIWTQNSSGVNSIISALVYANGSTDYFELYGNYNQGTNIFSAGPNFTYFQGYLVRAA